ncbi:agmatine deiminase family protein [Herbiconiux sp. KACC 21604]|uniref:agmatine deiminase family protein n=1 Tax=unclassified Herbiconiux TaxID=2618217 RepID=UPI00149203ED|nr:agmatine deiminase family protein [Herbiconiux sp. SALV-R1]QJU55446.1 agmatine deiminase family protein [Herbiconiux sp. SALV-R1]WPO86628.1 agmatine deiminase family protein [Herbiconiux sp. KACC 21604]
MTWTMPAEWAPQERIWMAFPRPGYTLGDDPESAEEGRRAWAAVANAAAGFEPVTMVVDPSSLADARRLLSAEIELVEAPLDDFWMRDIGPSFVLADNGRLGAVDWTFNGWGATSWTTWDRDSLIGERVGTLAGAEIVTSVLVNEGGGLHVDGEGTVLVTETVQLDPFRNPYLTKARVEAELRRTLGATTVVWLPRGLTRDYQAPGTRGHVDMVAAFAGPGRVLLHWQDDPAHPDYGVVRQVRAVLEQSTDARGRSFEIIELPAPTTLRDAEGFVDWNYANHLVVNGGVIACGYGEPEADARAASILAEAYGREVVTVDARPILERGGGVHCITQQQPVSVSGPASVSGPGSSRGGRDVA